MKLHNDMVAPAFTPSSIASQTVARYVISMQESLADTVAPRDAIHLAIRTCVQVLTTFSHLTKPLGHAT